MWKHPNYYKKLRASLVKKSDQAISQANSTRGLSDVRPGPGQSSKRQAATGPGASCKQQASSLKHQAVQKK